MTLAPTRFESTPNPDALKVILQPPNHPALPLAPNTRWFTSASTASADPLAHALLRIPGVVSVLVGPGWITLSRTRGSPTTWPAIQRAVTAALKAFSAPQDSAP